ncbi:MAG: alpha/beta hydrolase family protein [Aestuariibaculum sp.]
MLTKQHIVIKGKHNKPILIDVTYTGTLKTKPIVIFCHGYKGFKDWGAWNLMAEAFANKDIYFLKFNFSHNGGTVEQPIDFPDLDAFGNNNYTKELDDLETVIDWVYTNADIKTIANVENIILIGHSRGGGISLIKAQENYKIKGIISWASVCNFGSRAPISGNTDSWKKTGVKYVVNGRTNQDMPHYYQFYEDFIANKERLDIKCAVSKLKIPHLIIHGDKDISVLPIEAQHLHKWNTNSQLEIINDADHVFGVRHPWNRDEIPPQLTEVITKTIAFIKN